MKPALVGKPNLQEETRLSADDLKFKVKRLEVYIKKADRRISLLEKKLAKVEGEIRSQGNLLKKKVLA